MPGDGCHDLLVGMHSHNFKLAAMQAVVNQMLSLNIYVDI